MEETFKPLKSDDRLKHYPLTPFRLIRGLVCLLVYISTAFMFVVYFAPVAAVLMRLFSIHYCRKATSFLFALWLALWPFLFEKINGTKVVFSGDLVPPKERVLIISNHRTEVDWMYLWNLALRKGCLGYIKYILKSSLMKLPVFGWGFHILEFISVERKWEVDEPAMRQMLSTFKDSRDPLWLVLFPEGTDFSEQKCQRSQKFASEVGLPVLANVLLPKTRGFCLCLEVLQNSLDAVYDVSIAYKHQLPTFLDNVFGTDPSEVHIHVQRIPAKDIPASDAEAATWLIDRFQLKDQLLLDFKAQGHFPNEGNGQELSTLKCLVNFTVLSALNFFDASLHIRAVKNQPCPLKSPLSQLASDSVVCVTRFRTPRFSLYSLRVSSQSDQQHLILSTEVSEKRMEVVDSHQNDLNGKSISGNVGNATVFTLQNQCSYTLWPGTLSGNGAATLGDGGFTLVPGASVQFQAPPGWSGRFWARTGCTFDESGSGKCITGDCGGTLNCVGGGAPPVSLVEFTIGTNPNDKDFYDVSLVDGYNVGLGVKALGGYGDCQYAGCVTDLNSNCPAELRVLDSGSTVACKSACAAFNAPEFCCTADHATPQTCSPTQYSVMFKNACPTAYSYAYDDASSTCTCTGADYLITFCPNGSG
ncbi:hypothetical protein DKX38_020637 [Salix brachista]|uniref:1-acylglycerol-3-phosphate O-acyltransferase n=1 Tax=Salix brachista TaxID=2182728 RepID=A0A5N5KAL2_9ROSI|nr:hypothetical protein DKX38_020637 [Salix brachista]